MDVVVAAYKKRIGLLLGSFNPIHVGHVYMATQALNAGLVDEVLFVPSMQNPWKEDYQVSFLDRCTMTCLAIDGHNNMFVSGIEATLTAPYYSYKTLHAIKDQYPDSEFYLIVGADVVPTIKFWENGDWILNNFKFVTVARPGCDCTVKANILKTIDVSSTEVRKLIKEGKYIYPLVPREVEIYINTHNLYK